MNPLVTKFVPTSCFTRQYTRQRPDLIHNQSALFPWHERPSFTHTKLDGIVAMFILVITFLCRRLKGCEQKVASIPQISSFLLNIFTNEILICLSRSKLFSLCHI
jgi:hypothetical protein